MKIKSILLTSILALFSGYALSQTVSPASAPSGVETNNGSTKIIVKQDSDYSQAGVQTRMPMDSEKYINGQLVRPKSVENAPTMGADPTPAPVFTTMEAASQAGINPLATQNVEVTASPPEVAPEIEKDNLILDWTRQNKDGIIAGALILFIGLGLSYYNKMKTAAQLREIEDETDSQQDD